MEITDEMRIEFRNIIIDHFSNPSKKGSFNEKENIFFARQKSAVCADDIFIELKIVDNVIIDARFDGIGCAFSTAAADILLQNICNMSVGEAYKYLENYNNMCTGKEYSISDDDEIKIFQTVRKEINRVNCVLLSAEGIRNIIEGKK